MRITKEQVLQLEADGNECVRDWFPEVFKVNLEVGKWYKLGDKFMFNFSGKYSRSNNSGSYGFTMSGKWYDNLGISVDEIYKVATDKEVEIALKNEALKRGFKEGVWFESAVSEDYFKFNYLFINDNDFSIIWNKGCGVIFKDGIWAEIIPTITKEEAEEKLKCKII